MADVWIKMMVDLHTHPKVVRIMSALKADRFRVIGGLHAVWCVFDAHSEDGKLEGYTMDMMDQIIGWAGFSSAMAAVGWLLQNGETLVAPDFEQHNGKSAKRRAQDTVRKQSVRTMSASQAEKNGTREEKIREDINTPHNPPEGGATTDEPDKKKSRAVAFKTFLADCDAAGEKPISGYKPVWDFAETVGLPRDWVVTCWLEFHRRHEPGGVNESKRYTNWRRAFRNCLEGNWYHLWSFDTDGSPKLTSAGIQAQKATA